LTAFAFAAIPFIGIANTAVKALVSAHGKNTELWATPRELRINAAMLPN